MKRLQEVQKEKESLIKKVQSEEENIQNNLKKKLKSVHQEKVDLENELEKEQEYIGIQYCAYTITILSPV